MTWTLNELLKITDVTTVPGSPGTPGDPGIPSTPGYWRTVTPPGGSQNYPTVHSQLPPSRTDENFQGYRTFNGVEYELAGTYFTQDVPPILYYTYRAPPAAQEQPYQEWVPATAGTPPTEGTPATPASFTEDFNLGWNSGATGPSLNTGEIFKWRLMAGSVGCSVGVSKTSSLQDETYRTFAFGVITQSGQWALLVDGSVTGSYRPFDDFTQFSILRSDTGASLVVDGAVIYTYAHVGGFLPDSSLYSGGDRIWDAAIVTVGSAGQPPIVGDIDPETGEIIAFGSTTVSQAQATAVRTITFGPGTHRGVIGASTQSSAVNGSVLVNGIVLAGGGMTTISDADAVPYIIRTMGFFGATTASAAAAIYESFMGSADLTFEPMDGRGSVDGVYVGGSDVSFEELTVSSTNDLIVPSTALANLVMVGMSVSALGVSGEVVVSADLVAAPMAGFSSEDDYAASEFVMHPMRGYGESLGEGGYGTLFGSFSFLLNAQAYPADMNVGILRSKDQFRIEGYAGAQFAAATFGFSLVAEATGSNIGELRAVVGYG